MVLWLLPPTVRATDSEAAVDKTKLPLPDNAPKTGFVMPWAKLIAPLVLVVTVLFCNASYGPQSVYRR